MSEGKITEQDFVKKINDSVGDNGIVRVNQGVDGIEVHIDSLTQDSVVDSLLKIGAHKDYEHISSKLTFHCDVELRIKKTVNLQRIHFQGGFNCYLEPQEHRIGLFIKDCHFEKDLIFNSLDIKSFHEVEIQNCNFQNIEFRNSKTDEDLKVDNGEIDEKERKLKKHKTYINKLKLKDNCKIHQISLMDTHVTELKLEKTTIHSPISLFKYVTVSFTADRCRFMETPKLNFERSPHLTIQFIRCQFDKFLNLYDYNDIGDLDILSFKNCNWSFSEYTKTRLLSLIEKFNKDRDKALNKLKHSFFLLRNIYSAKNLEHETRQLQRLINYIHLEQNAFTEKERRALRWSRRSNDFGTNYMRGICFTLSWGISFYLLLLLLLKVNGDIYPDISVDGAFAILAHFIDLINVTKWKLKFFGLEDNNIVNFTVYVARIFIGYGIYQTISAFRIITKM